MWGSRVLPPLPLAGLIGQIKAYGENNSGGGTMYPPRHVVYRVSPSGDQW
jgi:hypothetical protein